MSEDTDGLECVLADTAHPGRRNGITYGVEHVSAAEAYDYRASMNNVMEVEIV